MYFALSFSEVLVRKSGRVTILNADNGLRGPGAIWDLSRAVVGDRIPPGATTYNTITLKFHTDLGNSKLVVTNSLLGLTASISGADGVGELGLKVVDRELADWLMR